MTKIVKESQLVKSLRESDFDRYSAYGEIFDNSIQAEAKNIKTKISYKSEKRGNKNYELIDLIAFGDDGNGMNIETIEQCLVLGYSERYGDRKGIGRFGVGFTLGSLHECKNIEVYSKTTNSEWHQVSFEVADDSEDQKEITPPQKKSPPDDLKELAGEDSGTIVVWKNLDKQLGEQATHIIEESKIWTGRTYRTFIKSGVNFTINGENVYSIDPLYIDTETTKFPNDPKAYEYKEIIIEDWPIDENLDSSKYDKTDTQIKIRLSLLPEEFRKRSGDGAKSEVNKRHIDRNEGISILRNGREVFYGIPPFWPQGGVSFIEGRTPWNRWWGCEVSFNAVHDRSFQVKNIKRGASPILELKKLINHKISPTIKTAIDTVREVWDKNKSADDLEKQASGLSTDHDEAENIVKNTPGSKMKIVEGKTEDEIKENREKIVGNIIKQNQAAWETKFAAQPFTIVPSEWQGKHFLESAYTRDGAVMKYNQRHLFHQTINDIKADLEKASIEDKDAIVEVAKKLNTMIDLLLISYTKAEGDFSSDSFTKVTPEEVVEELRMNWGTYLDRYIKKWNQSSDN